MDVISQRQIKRRGQINIIIASIKKALGQGLEIDKKRLILSTMCELDLSQRTAKEYVEVALFEIEK